MTGSDHIHGFHVASDAALHGIVEGHGALFIRTSHHRVEVGARECRVGVQIADDFSVGIDLGRLDVGLPALLNADLGHVGEKLGRLVASVARHLVVEHDQVLAELLLAWLRANFGLNFQGELGAEHGRDSTRLKQVEEIGRGLRFSQIDFDGVHVHEIAG